LNTNPERLEQIGCEEEIEEPVLGIQTVDPTFHLRHGKLVVENCAKSKISIYDLYGRSIHSMLSNKDSQEFFLGQQGLVILVIEKEGVKPIRQKVFIP
jgi:hypothetical protein